MEIIICITMFSIGFACGMYAASNAETHIENKINPKMKMSKKELGLKNNKNNAPINGKSIRDDKIGKFIILE